MTVFTRAAPLGLILSNLIGLDWYKRYS
jgi:hypothetical protein